MFLLFFLAWVIFNGRITMEIVILGIVVAAAVFAFMCRFMDYSMKREKRFYGNIVFFFRYLTVLIKEIIVANMTVLHLVSTQKEMVEPVIVKFNANLKTDTARVFLANSITLTPGTITVSLEENEYVVHCLDKSLAEGMENSVFVKMLEDWEEKGE